MAIKIRRGTDTARLAVIFEEGEVVYTTDTKSFFIGDGVTAGGNQIGGTTAASLLKATVHNATGVTLTKGQVVYLNGNTGNKPNAVLAQANSEATSSKTIGLIILNISNNASGDIATDGLIGDLNTSAFVAGDLLWLSDSIAGGVTTIIPDTPSHAVFIGYVVRAHPTQGSILIHIQNGYELNELHDVKITSVQNNDGLIYDSSLGYWKNSNTVTVQGNTFNAANKLVQLDGTAKLPAVDGSQLTNLPTPATPTLASVTTAGNTTTNAITVGGLTVDTDTLYVDTTNNRVGIGTVTPSQPLHIIGRTRIASSTGTSLHLYNDGSTSLIDSLTNGNAAHDLRISAQNISFYSGASYGTVYAKLFNTGNFALGSNPTDAGYKLDVNGSTRVKGAGATSATTALLVQNSTPADIFTIANDGSALFDLITSGSAVSIRRTATPTSRLIQFLSSGGARFFTYDGEASPNANGDDGAWFFKGRHRRAANNGIASAFKIEPFFAQEQFDTIQLNSIHIVPNIFISGTATNVTVRGIYYNPTIVSLTGVVAHRAIETTSGNIVFNGGNVLIGTTTDAGYKLDVNGTARVSNTLTVGSESLQFVTGNSRALINASGSALINFGISSLVRMTLTSSGLAINLAGETAPNASSLLELISTTKGFLPPRMTTTEKNAIATPAAGLVVYDTTLNKLCVRTAAAWETITSI